MYSLDAMVVNASFLAQGEGGLGMWKEVEQAKGVIPTRDLDSRTSECVGCFTLCSRLLYGRSRARWHASRVRGTSH
jgi:hypothetical protein